MVSVREAKSRMIVLERKFRKACKYVILFNQRIKDKQVRYKRAYQQQQRAWGYTLRLQLSTMEGIRHLYHEYACQKARELEALQEVLVQAGVLSDHWEELDWNEGV